MDEKLFMRASEVAKELDVSMAYSYKLIQTLNQDLKKRGFITINGRVSRQYFNKKLYGVQPGGARGGKDVGV